MCAIPSLDVVSSVCQWRHFDNRRWQNNGMVFVSSFTCWKLNKINKGLGCNYQVFVLWLCILQAKNLIIIHRYFLKYVWNTEGNNQGHRWWCSHSYNCIVMRQCTKTSTALRKENNYFIWKLEIKTIFWVNQLKNIAVCCMLCARTWHPQLLLWFYLTKVIINY